MKSSVKYCLWLVLLLTVSVSQAGRFEEGAGAFYIKDYKAAFELWMPLAESGNATCQVLIGSMYAFGQGVEKSDKAAAIWFRRAAEQGSAQGQYNLAVMYENGWGVEKDIDTAIFWFTKAARHGREDARRKYLELERQKYLASQQQPDIPAAETRPETEASAAVDEPAAVSVNSGTTASDEPPPPPQIVTYEPATEVSATIDKSQAAAIEQQPPINIETSPAARNEVTSAAVQPAATDEAAPLAPVSSLNGATTDEPDSSGSDSDNGSAEQYSSFPNPFEFIGLLLGDVLGGETAGSNDDTGFADDAAPESNWPRKDFSARPADDKSAAAPVHGADNHREEEITRTPDGRVQMILPPASAAD